MKSFFSLLCLLCLFAACSPVAASTDDATPLPLSTALSPVPTFTATATPTATHEPTPTAAPPTATPTSSLTPFAALRASLTPTVTRTPATPTATPDWAATRVALGRYTSVPILMYHHIAIPPERADQIRLDLSVWPQHFDEQLAYLSSHGFHTVKLLDVFQAVVSGAPLPSNPIVLTFDDGYDDNYLNALPILEKYNFVGTFYVPTGLLERPGYMTWEQVVALSKAGMDVQSHSVTHPSLKGKTLAFLRKELGDSKAALEAHLGHPIYFFCYPSGQYDALTIQVLQEMGYVSATTTQPGAHQYQAAPYEWSRVRVRGSDTVGELVGRMNLLLYGR